MMILMDRSVGAARPRLAQRDAVVPSEREAAQQKDEH